jgi:hypothetical protein
MTMHRHEELQPSWTSELDAIAMQPHSREYLEYRVNRQRSEQRQAKIEPYPGLPMDDGIHFGDTP